MKIIAISGLLLAGLVSVVSAEPAKNETAERVSYTTTEKAQAPDDDWIELASPTPAKHGRTFITVDGRYTQLRIAPHKGRPSVKTVRVVYADGKQRTFKVRKPVIDLGGVREISHLVVDADSRSKGSYTVHGALQPTGVATR